MLEFEHQSSHQYVCMVIHDHCGYQVKPDEVKVAHDF